MGFKRVRMGILMSVTDKKGLGFGSEKGWNGHSNDMKRLES